MKKQLLGILCLSGVFFVSAQTDCMCLKGQRMPLYDTFHEIRYQDVDSIVFMTKSRPEDEFIAKSYTLIKRSVDGLTDTLEVHGNIHLEPVNEIGAGESEAIEQRLIVKPPAPYIYRDIKKYTREGKLTWEYSSGYNYKYDEQGRMIEEKSSDFITTYDYDNKMIYSGGHPLLDCCPEYIICTDSGYIAKRLEWNFKVDTIVNIYTFDAANRLVCEHSFMPEYRYPSEDNHDTVITTIDTSLIEYKYADDGYEEYHNGFKYCEYTFRKDGHRTDVVTYRRYHEITDGKDADRDAIYYFSIDKYIYFKNGQEVSNALVEVFSPKVYGVEGAVIVDLKQVAVVHVYSLTGSLVKKASMGEGNTMIPLSKGIYIVRIGDLSYKVLVR